MNFVYFFCKSRDARPQLDCIQEANQDACLTALRDEAADLVMIDGADVKKAIEEYNIKPIVAESYGTWQTKFSEVPAVAVIKKNSVISNFGMLIFPLDYYLKIKYIFYL